MKLSIGADHAGFLLKEELRRRLADAGHEVIDRGATSAEPCDYPLFAAAVGKDVAAGAAERGILVCGSGIGMMISAN
jgi:ribose 5-phosphate isomerase B